MNMKAIGSIENVKKKQTVSFVNSLKNVCRFVYIDNQLVFWKHTQ